VNSAYLRSHGQRDGEPGREVHGALFFWNVSTQPFSPVAAYLIHTLRFVHQDSEHEDQDCFQIFQSELIRDYDNSNKILHRNEMRRQSAI